MICPLCQQPLVKRYRVVHKVHTGPMRTVTAYHPLWWCEFHKFSVEINYPRGKLVSRKPGRRPTTPRPGSAREV